MQAIKNGIKCTLRTPGKALLFTLILAVLAALLAVAFCVFSAVRGYLKEADEYFHTIATIDYVGKDYPDQSVYDPEVQEAVAESMTELQALKANPAVMGFEPASPALGYIEGMHRIDNNVFNGSAGVLIVKVNTYDPGLEAYQVLFERSLYARKDYSGTLMYLSADRSGIEKGKTYIVSGRFVAGKVSGVWFNLESMSFVENGETVTVPEFELVPNTEVPETNVFYRLAKVLEKQNDACRVVYTSAIEDYYPFQQQILSLKDGRLFSEQEQKDGAKVCLIMNDLAGRLDLSVGDRIPLSVCASDENIFATDTLYEKDGGEYEVIGILNEDIDYPFYIFLPGASGDGFRATTGYNLGQFRVVNSRADEFIAASEKLAHNGFRITLYDQGYAAATEPMRELMFISIIFLAVCVVLAIVALILQSHIFVSRQKEAANTMYSLGSSRAHIVAYFISAVLILTILGTVIGAFAAKAIEGRVFETMQRFATQFAKENTDYSLSSTSITRTLDFAPNAGYFPYIAAGAALVLGALITTIIFARRTVTERRKQERSRIKEQGVSRFSVKYALLSIIRSPVRTLAVLLLAAVAALFFSRLTASLRGYNDQLESYKRSAEITGYATDMKGRWMDGLNIKNGAVKALMEKELAEDYNLTTKLGSIDILGVGKTASGASRAVQFSEPQSEFAKETRVYNISRAMKWVSTTDVESSPVFKYAKSKSITWLDGFDKKDFWFPNPVCALPESVMKEKGIELGDCVVFEHTFSVSNWNYLGTVMLKVAASYSATTSSNTVFVPFSEYPLAPTDYGRESYLYDHYGEEYTKIFAPILADSLDERIKNRVINGIESIKYNGWFRSYERFQSVSYKSFLFTLKDATRLDELREAFKEAGYGTVGNMSDRGKTFFVIEDEMYLSTVRSMQRQIQYVSTLYAALYVIAGVIGFALAWLLTVSRRKEIALMRALGTPNFRIILNFLFEHALLCLVGLGIGLLIAILIFGAQEKICFMLCAAFFILWCISTFICLVFGLAKKAQAALVEVE
jgi:ABC-type lipoprotein release transport system permease subunit